MRASLLAGYRVLEGIPLAGPAFTRLKYASKRSFCYYLSPAVRKQWAPRIQDVLDCPDNAFIPRHRLAGRLIGGQVIMHNGLKIAPDSYFGEPMRLILEKNRGVHEPQEERVFQEVLPWLPHKAVMVELGAYWGFYSLWFHQQIKQPRCILVEPDVLLLQYGKDNFALNGFRGTFHRSLVGARAGRADDGTPILSVDDLLRDEAVEHLHILHADIQGAEADMLAGARQALEARKVDYIFISTHSNQLHGACRAFLQDRNYLVLADADLQETYSFDGLLVARRAELAGLDPVPIAKKAPGARR
jgi:hypothetical protein